MFASPIRLSAHQQDRLQEQLIPETIANGYSLGHDFLDEDQVFVLQSNIARFRKNFIIGLINQSLYDVPVPTSSSTLTRASQIRQLRSKEYFHVAFDTVLMTPKSFVPNIIRLGNQLEDCVQQYGKSTNEQLLQNWRLGSVTLLNYMLPHGRTGLSPRHIDAGITPSGIRFAFALGPAILETDKVLHDTQTGDLEVFIASDLAKINGVSLVNHAVTPTGPRATYVFDAVPQT